MKKMISIALSSLLLMACNKEFSEQFSSYTNNELNDTLWTASKPNLDKFSDLAKGLTPVTFGETFDASKGDTINFNEPISVEIPKGSLVNNIGRLQDSGKARVELLWLRKKGDFIKCFKATTSGESILESAGEVFVRVYHYPSGQDLGIHNSSAITIKFRENYTLKNNLQLFQGKESNPFGAGNRIDTAHTWNRAADSSFLPTWQGMMNGANLYGYVIKTNQLRWLGASRFIEKAASTTNVYTLLPQNFTNKNTLVFLVFKNFQSVVSLRADAASKCFWTKNIPVGVAVKLVSLSQIGSNFYYGEKEISAVANGTAYKIEPAKKTIAEITTALNNL
jgi:hypothetical protein